MTTWPNDSQNDCWTKWPVGEMPDRITNYNWPRNEITGLQNNKDKSAASFCNKVSSMGRGYVLQLLSNIKSHNF